MSVHTLWWIVASEQGANNLRSKLVGWFVHMSTHSSFYTNGGYRRGTVHYTGRYSSFLLNFIKPTTLSLNKKCDGPKVTMKQHEGILCVLF
jgi:hypothetical protein